MNSVRTCLGCRERADRSLLVRVVARDGEAVVDVSATLPGRGAWVHPTTRCVETAIARKAVARGLRADGALGTAGLLTAVATLQSHDTVGVPSGTP
ncbi:YlxR family protein [Lacisediminihabitans sp. FW035]